MLLFFCLAATVNANERITFACHMPVLCGSSQFKHLLHCSIYTEGTAELAHSWWLVATIPWQITTMVSQPAMPCWLPLPKSPTEEAGFQLHSCHELANLFFMIRKPTKAMAMLTAAIPSCQPGFNLELLNSANLVTRLGPHLAVGSHGGYWLPLKVNLAFGSTRALDTIFCPQGD